MLLRTMMAKVAFRRPFRIEGYDGVFQPGVYAIETDEQALGGLSFVAFQRVRVAIHLHRSECRPGNERTVIVSGPALDAAIKRDQVGSGARPIGPRT